MQLLEARVCCSATVPQLAVPPVIYAVAGQSTSINFENLVPTLNADGLRFEVTCALGTATASQWTATPQSAEIGDHTWQMTLWQDTTLLDSRSAVVRVTEPVDPGRSYNLLLVGDSLTHASLYPNDLSQQFATDGIDVTLLGTHHPAEAAPNVFHEGYGGWTWNRFLTHYEPNPNPALNKRSSPFVFLENGTARFNLPRYFESSLGGSKPDFVTFLLGINDCIWLDTTNPEQVDAQIQSVLNSAESLVEKFRAALPDTEFGIGLTPPPNARESAFTANYAGHYTRENWKPIQHQLVTTMIERFQGREHERIFVVPTGLNMSPAESYPENNAVHPNERGYSEIADTMYAWLQSRMQPQTPALSAATFSLNENAPRDTAVGTIATTNAIPSRRPMFSMVSSPASAAFAIDPLTGALRVTDPTALDFETNSTLELQIRASDPYVSALSQETTVTIQLQDVNEAPVVSVSSTLTSLSEADDTSSRIKVADVTVTDDALGVHTLTLSGPSAAMFELDAGALYLKSGTVLDYETLPSLVVHLDADDAAIGTGVDASVPYVLALTDVNEPPDGISLRNPVPQLVEGANSTGRVSVAEIVINDDAIGENALVLSGTDAGNFEIADGRLYVRAEAVLDFETRPVQTVTIAVQDVNQNHASVPEITFVLQVLDANDPVALGTVAATQSITDEQTVAPFQTLTLADPDTQDMFVRVTLINGANRGDLTPASTDGWTRSAVGHDIVYTRYLPRQTNVGASAELLVQGLVFQPRMNAVTPNTSEACDVALFVSDGLSHRSAITRIVTTSRNDAPTLGGLPTTAIVSDNTLVNPFRLLTVIDRDQQDMVITTTILNGVHRGDFTDALSAGWTNRQVVGNDLVYTRYFPATPDVGSVAQAAFRALTFQSRQNVLRPNTSELVDFQVTVSDGVAPAIADRGTRLTVISVNDFPMIEGATPTAVVTDNATLNPFGAVVVTDRDFQEMSISTTILNGVHRGDFTSASTAGWSTRRILGNDLVYTRYFSPQADVGAAAQAALRALVFQPRTDALRPGTTELTDFHFTVSDGVATPIANRETRVTTVSVNDAPSVSGINPAIHVADDSVTQPFATVNVNDRDTQELLVTVTIRNGVFRGDFVNAQESGWNNRQLFGNDIVYQRYFNPSANVGAAAQAALRALTFQPRTNAITPGSQELTDFPLTVQDGVAPPIHNSGTRVTTTSVNDAPTMTTAPFGQVVHASSTLEPLAVLSVRDADVQDMLAQVTIVNGVNTGDLVAASTTAWTRRISGANIIYTRYFSPAANVGSIVQTALRRFQFQARADISIDQALATSFQIDLKDGTGTTTTNSETSVVVTGPTPQ